MIEVVEPAGPGKKCFCDLCQDGEPTFRIKHKKWISHDLQLCTECAELVSAGIVQLMVFRKIREKQDVSRDHHVDRPV